MTITHTPKSEEDWWVQLARATATKFWQHEALDALVELPEKQRTAEYANYNTKRAQVKPSVASRDEIQAVAEKLEDMRGKNADKKRRERARGKKNPKGHW